MNMDLVLLIVFVVALILPVTCLALENRGYESVKNSDRPIIIAFVLGTLALTPWVNAEIFHFSGYFGLLTVALCTVFLVCVVPMFLSVALAFRFGLMPNVSTTADEATAPQTPSAALPTIAPNPPNVTVNYSQTVDRSKLH